MHKSDLKPDSFHFIYLLRFIYQDLHFQKTLTAVLVIWLVGYRPIRCLGFRSNSLIIPNFTYPRNQLPSVEIGRLTFNIWWNTEGYINLRTSPPKRCSSIMTTPMSLYRVFVRNGAWPSHDMAIGQARLCWTVHLRSLPMCDLSNRPSSRHTMWWPMSFTWKQSFCRGIKMYSARFYHCELLIIMN